MGPLYHEIGADRPAAGVSTRTDSGIQHVFVARVSKEGYARNIYIACTKLTSHIYTYDRDPCSFLGIPTLRWSLSGETLDRGGRRSTPITFSVRGLNNRIFA